MHVSRRAVLQALAAAASLSSFVPMTARAAQPMRIGIVGAGWLGGTVGKLWVQAGHEVLFSSRHPDELLAMTKPLGPRATVGMPLEAATFGTVILIAVPYEALPQIGRDLETAWHGKVVLDACNASGSGGDSASRGAQADGAGVTSAKLLPGTRLVRAFGAVDATSAEASFGRQGGKLGVPLASDDADAMRVAAQLVRDAGCEPVVVGNLAAGRTFERNGPGFRANTTAPDLRRRLGMPAGTDAP